MNKIQVFLLLFVAILLVSISSAEIIDESTNKVILDDVDVLIKTDYIRTGSGYIYPEITYKNLPNDAANIDLGFGVNTDEMKFISGDYWNPHYAEWETQHQQDFYNVGVIGVYYGDDLDYGNSYNTYKRIIEHDVANGTDIDRITSNVSFDNYTQWGEHYTIFWHTNESGIQDWQSIPRDRISIYNIDYDGKDKWYVLEDVPVVENELNRLRIYVELKHEIGNRRYKYDVITKLSSDTFQEAVLNNRLKLIDPYGDATNFNSTWNTSKTSTGSTDNTSIKLPLEVGGTYDFTVWWGDGTNDTITAYDQANVTHTYASQGEYDVVIDGTIQGFRFNNGGDRLKLLNITNWGNLRLGNSNGYFYGCSNLNVGATDTLDLTGTTTFSNAFYGCSGLTTLNVSAWDTSSVTTFAVAFYGCSGLTTLNVSAWDTSSVTTFSNAFYGCSGLTTLTGIGDWNVSACIDFTNMLYGVTLSTINYDSLLNGWAALPTLSTSEAFHGGNSKYSCNAVSARNDTLIGVWSWTITDGGLDDTITCGYPSAITSWQNNKTLNNTLDFTINTSEEVNFNATANQTITTWNWYKDDADQSHNYDNITLNWSTAGLKHVIVNATNANGTSESVQWNVTVESLEEYIQEQIQFYFI